MSRNTGATAISGMMTAMAVVILYAASLVPTGRLAVTALAGVVGAVTVTRCGIPYAAVSWIAVSVLAVLLLPNKGCAIAYAAFFGPYTILKSLIERINRQPVEWALKIAYCVAASLAAYMLSTDVLSLFPKIISEYKAVFLIAVCAAFVAYDIVFSKLISEIIRRITKL